MILNIHSIETMGALDGPGLRTVFFFQGCPMRCKYCHNADTFSSDGAKIEMTVTAAVDFCKRYKNYYGDGGGVTLSGGEPLLQTNGTIEFLTALKAAGIHTALDTSGAVYSEAALDLADLVILDIKHTDEKEFLSLTKHTNANTLKTLNYLKQNKKRFWVRQVIVPNITDNIDNIIKLKQMSQGAEKIELLPYHSMGQNKWEKLGLRYELKNTAPPTPEVMQKLNDILKS